MTQTELCADVLNRNFDMLKMTLADFSDADLLVRPCPGANHAAWQIGHLIVAETRLINGVTPAAMPELPAGFADHFNKETASKDDPNFFPGKSPLMDQFSKTRQATVKWVSGLTQADLDKPMSGPVAQRVPTVGHLVMMLPGHVLMHLGQFQVIRRKLGKPILF
ncbi:MAG TPA: DinB family protein [Tepidisphaeraceae bacterium]|nr:DinB family protein [Tepidisphaeraceae bacterium]